MCINSNEMEHTTMTLTFTRKSGTHFKVASVKYGPSVNKVKNVDMLNHIIYIIGSELIVLTGTG